MDLTAIINWLLWRLAPAAWLEGVIDRLIAWAFAVLEDETEQDWLDERPRNSHWFGGWLVIAEARLDELIDLRAHQLLNWRRAPRDVPQHYPAPAVRSFDDCVVRLARLIQRFEDVDRLAQRRVETLERLCDDTVIDLIPDHRPAEAAESTDFTAPAAAFFCARVSVHSHPSLHCIRAPP